MNLFKYKEEVRKIIIFLIMCVSFSIPFGYIYSQKINAVILLLWLYVVKKEDIMYLFKNKVLIVMFLFIISHYLTLPFSIHIDQGLYEIRNFWRFIFVPIIIYLTVVKKNDIKYIINAFVFSMFINEIISYMIYFDLYNTEFSLSRGYPVGFINHIQYSVLVAFSAILILYQAWKMKNDILKYVYLLFFITMTTNLVISGGRTGYVVYFASLIVLLFVYYKFSWINFFKILLLPLIVFFIGYKMNSQVQQRIDATLTAVEQLKNKKNYNTSLGTRIAFYPLVYDMLSQEDNSFIFGVGMGDLKEELHSSIKRTKLITRIYSHLHSSYLTAYVNAGIIGLFLLLYMFYLLFRLKFNNREFEFIKYLFLLNFAIGIVPDILLTQKITMVYFSVFISLILAQEREEYARAN